MVTYEHVLQTLSKISPKKYFDAAKKSFEKYGYSGLYVQCRITLSKMKNIHGENAERIRTVLSAFCEQEKAIHIEDKDFQTLQTLVRKK